MSSTRRAPDPELRPYARPRAREGARLHRPHARGGRGDRHGAHLPAGRAHGPHGAGHGRPHRGGAAPLEPARGGPDGAGRVARPRDRRHGPRQEGVGRRPAHRAGASHRRELCAPLPRAQFAALCRETFLPPGRRASGERRHAAARQAVRRGGGPALESAAHRAILCAALAALCGPGGAESVLSPVSLSQDIEATIGAARALGVRIAVEGDRCTVSGGALPQGEARIDCGESGSTLRFLIPVARRSACRPRSPAAAACRSGRSGFTQTCSRATACRAARRAGCRSRSRAGCSPAYSSCRAT